VFPSGYLGQGSAPLSSRNLTVSALLFLKHAGIMNIEQTHSTAATSACNTALKTNYYMCEKTVRLLSFIVQSN